LARALIVGCGCRGSALAGGLLAAGWQVRGTTRSETRLDQLEAAGIEPIQADPDHPGTVVDAIEGVAVVVWLMGTATGDPEVVGAIHGARLEAVIEELVDSGVRGLYYEGAGTVDGDHLRAGAEIVETSGGRWSMPVAVHLHDPSDHSLWLESALGVVQGLIR